LSFYVTFFAALFPGEGMARKKERGIEVVKKNIGWNLSVEGMLRLGIQYLE